LLRLFPAAALVLLIAPVAAGVAGILLPAFGYLPVLGRAELSLAPFRDLAAIPGLPRSVLLSLLTGLASTAVALLSVTLFIAGWRGTRVFAVLERLVSPLLSVPHAAAAFGLVFLIAPAGFLARIVSPWATGWQDPPDLLIVQDRLGIAMTAGLIVKEIPFLLLMSLAALPQARPVQAEMLTVSLGYGRVLGFLYSVLPSLYAQIRLAVLAVLAFSTSVVDVALILGPTTPAPLAVRILQWHNDPDLDRHLLAAAGATLQIGVTGAALLLWLGGEKVIGLLARHMVATGWRARADGWLRRLGAALIALSVLPVLAGIALLALWSVAGPWRFPDALPQSWTAGTWARLGPGLAGPLRDTLALAAAASLLAVILALGALEHEARSGQNRSGRALKSLFVPLLVPQVAFLFGLQVLFSFLRMDGTFAAVLLVHLLFVFPYVLLSLSDPWWAWDPRFGQVASTLGRHPAAIFWRVKLPMLARPVLTAAAVGFAVSIGLYLPTLLIGAGRWPTITTETVALASGGDRKVIGATALLQALLPFMGFALAALASAWLFRNRRLMRASV
jgi:putative thiamine transport system permease protein